jgi:predicted nucleic acid-binding protein
MTRPWKRLACDPKDRHVLAAAVRADAAAIVTVNIRDFPAPSVESFEIEIIDPDTFLLDQLDLAPAVVTD